MVVPVLMEAQDTPDSAGVHLFGALVVVEEMEEVLPMSRKQEKMQLFMDREEEAEAEELLLLVLQRPAEPAALALSALSSS
jgi:hypothetical protein